nr:zinc-binding dehydrogenase [Arthrobacter castelli]
MVDLFAEGFADESGPGGKVPGQVRPVVDTIHPLADVAAAHRALEAGGVQGKHVVHIG